MVAIYDFYIDFQFWPNLSLPRDFQMAMAYPWQFPGLRSQKDGSRNLMDGF